MRNILKDANANDLTVSKITANVSSETKSAQINVSVKTV